MITDYEVVSEHDVAELKSKVRDMLASGWQPFGSLHVSEVIFNYGLVPLYTQAMVKIQIEAI